MTTATAAYTAKIANFIEVSSISCTLLRYSPRMMSVSYTHLVVRDMLGIAVHHQASGVLLICCSGFTRDAQAFARDKQIQLVDGPALVDMIASATFE